MGALSNLIFMALEVDSLRVKKHENYLPSLPLLRGVCKGSRLGMYILVEGAQGGLLKRPLGNDKLNWPVKMT